MSYTFYDINTGDKVFCKFISVRTRKKYHAWAIVNERNSEMFGCSILVETVSPESLVSHVRTFNTKNLRGYYKNIIDVFKTPATGNMYALNSTGNFIIFGLDRVELL